MVDWKKYYLLGLILILAAALRLWNLPNNPPGLTWDEASLGYNAYSLLQTGRDEYGTFLPINLKSFGDYKPALYAYVDVPFVALFGLSELAVRLPSVIFGVFGVLGVFLLVNALFKNKRLSLLSAFFLAISPWHLQFSRPAFEANMALTFNIFAIYLFYKGLQKGRFLIFSAIIFGLSLLTYQASKLFIPLLVVGLVLIFWKKVEKSKFVIYCLAILVIFFLMIGFTFLSGQTSRLSTQNFFAYQRSQDDISTISREDGMDTGSAQFQILHGEWWAYVRGLTERYLIYFSPKMLFIDGDYSQRHKVPDLGALYYFSVILIPLGLVYFLRRGGSETKLLLFWLFISPMPAVLSRDLISTLRALNMVIPLTMLEAAGCFWMVTKIRGIKGGWKYLGILVVTLTVALNFFIYLDRYFIHAPKEYSKYWLYGYKQVLVGLETAKFNYQKVVISDNLGQPYIFYLFYNKYPPDKFQKQAVLDQPTIDVGTIRKIDNIEFRHIYWPVDRGEKRTLYLGSLEELPDKDILPFPEFKILEDINFLNGERAFRIVETK